MKRSRSMSHIRSAEESNAASSNTMSSNSNTRSNHPSVPSLSDPSLDASFLPFKSGLFQESSILAPATQFPNPTGSMSSESCNSNTRSLEHIHKSSNGSRQNEDPNRNQSSSLFGAVMKNIHHPNPSTPAKKCINKFAISPGGFQLQNLISGLGDSPLCIKTPGKKSASASKMSTPSSQTSSMMMTTTPRRDIDWHECAITSRQVGLLDWTLKQSLEFQFQSSCSILLENSTTPSLETMRDFLRGFDDKVDVSKETPMVDWNASLLFWQHPAIYPFPKEFMSNERPSKDIISLAENSNTTGDNSRSSSSQWMMSSMPPPRKIQQQQQRAFTSVAMTGTKRRMEDSKSIWKIRQNEWQESFRSLYFNWLDRIRELDGKIQQVQKRMQPDEIADTYFYACGKGHTILFRARVDKLVDGELSVVPEIVLSSSTLSLREKLRSMDVKLWLLERWGNQTGEFQESYLQTPAGTAVNNKENNDESPNIKMELMALRRAHVFGETVGADVSVLLKAKKSNLWSTHSTKQIPPLCVRGIDDCASFFEIYLNRCGRIASFHEQLTPEQWSDVPLLMCRRLGPFLHATMKSLCVTRRQASGSTTEGYSSMHVDGILMPCTVRKLLCAAVGVMQVAAHSCQKPAETRNEDNPVGTQNFVVQVTTHDGEENARKIGTGMIGSQSSKRFNGGKDFLCAVESCNNIQKCHYNESLEVAVWDITRPTSLAYKLEHSAL